MEIIKYLPDILICIVFSIAIVVVIINFVKSSPAEKKKRIVNILFGLAAEAERAYGSKTGKIKKSQVIAWFYKRYPVMGAFISEETLGNKIDEAAAELTTYLKDNPEAAANLLGIYPDINLDDFYFDDNSDVAEIPDYTNGASGKE